MDKIRKIILIAGIILVVILTIIMVLHFRQIEKNAVRINSNPYYTDTPQSTEDYQRITDVRQIMTALELYYNDAGGYPAAVTSGQKIACGTTSYTDIVPTNPLPGGMTYTYMPSGIVSTSSGCGNVDVYSDYTLKFKLDSSGEGLSAGIHTATSRGIDPSSGF
jgi:hypothetical protein